MILMCGGRETRLHEEKVQFCQDTGVWMFPADRQTEGIRYKEAGLCGRKKCTPEMGTQGFLPSPSSLL